MHRGVHEVEFNGGKLKIKTFESFYSEKSNIMNKKRKQSKVT